MKVAICFYGQPRFYKQVLPIWQKVIKELERHPYSNLIEMTIFEAPLLNSISEVA